MRVLILGGYGVFGGRLARLLSGRAAVAEIVVAGRDLGRAEAFAREIGATAARIDRDGDLRAPLDALRPDLVIDAAGPFQAYGADPYRLAKAALAVGAHYFDLADDAKFVAGIAALDDAAQAAGRIVLSGVSSVPAISSAAADALTRGLVETALIETAILPGNRAERGLSATRAILAQAGRPFRLWRGGGWRDAWGWSDARRLALGTLGTRRASLIGAPDLSLFPERYRAHSVVFRAGLELGLLHRGLTLASLPVRWGWIRSLAPHAKLFQRAAALLEPLGADRGAMMVRACGRDAAGRAVERRWTLFASGGDGPSVPAVPAAALTERLGALAPGARPCLGEASLDEIEAALTRLQTATERYERDAPRLFEASLGAAAWRRAPQAVRRLHDSWDLDRYAGVASVERGAGLLAALVARLFGLPPAAEAVSVAVEIRVDGERERWTRCFGVRRFHSVLSPAAQGGASGRLIERFGPIRVALDIAVDDGRLSLTPTRAWLGPIPLPRRATPRGTSYESEDADGRFRFDVEIGLPMIGRVVRYRGWLRPVS